MVLKIYPKIRRLLYKEQQKIWLPCLAEDIFSTAAWKTLSKEVSDYISEHTTLDTNQLLTYNHRLGTIIQSICDSTTKKYPSV